MKVVLAYPEIFLAVLTGANTVCINNGEQPADNQKEEKQIKNSRSGGSGSLGSSLGDGLNIQRLAFVT